MTTLRIGAGLGGSRKKPGCLFLHAASDWTLQGAWSSPPARKQSASANLAHPHGSLQDLARECDAVFVHTSTATHYQVVSELLNAGVHVCVINFAENVQDAERLIELAARKS